MKVGLDHLPMMPLFQWTPTEFMRKAAEYGYEGVALPAQPLTEEACRRQVCELAQELGLYLELGGAGIDAALSGKSPAELARAWKPLFAIAQEVGADVLITGLGTWPWEGRRLSEPGKRVADQIQGGIATLRELRPLAEDAGIAVAVHTAFFTAEEHVALMEAVDSPQIGLCLDTANAFLVLEDPVDFARRVAPWVKTTHFKDSCIYLHDGGAYWMGGCPLGRGTVDLTAIAEILFRHNPRIRLTVEDHWGRTPMPWFDPDYLDTFPRWDGRRVARLFHHLWEGEKRLRTGMHPTLGESQQIDWKEVFPARAQANACYARQLRDRLMQGDKS